MAQFECPYCDEKVDEICDLCQRCKVECCVCAPCPTCHKRIKVDQRCQYCKMCKEPCCKCIVCKRCENKAPTLCPHCNSCKNCCQCVTCKCEHVVNRTKQCPNCKNCMECCTCTRCKECTRRVPQVNPISGVCDQCDTNGTNPDLDYTPKFFDSSKFNKNGSHRYISCEIELSNFKRTNNHEFQTWCRQNGCRFVHDGSLPQQGIEIQTPPTNGDKFLNLIKELCRQMKAANAEITRACGYHVHIDARDLNYDQIDNLILLYSKIEDPIYQIVTKERKYNRFCLPSAIHYMQKRQEHDQIWLKNGPKKDNSKKKEENVNYALYGRGQITEEIRRQRRPHCRYFGLNIHAWCFRGSIEARMHQGTLSYNHLTKWGLLWSKIVDFATTTSTERIEAMGNNMDSLLEIAHTEDLKDWIRKRHTFFRKKKDRDDEHEE